MKKNDQKQNERILFLEELTKKQGTIIENQEKIIRKHSQQQNIQINKLNDDHMKIISSEKSKISKLSTFVTEQLKKNDDQGLEVKNQKQEIENVTAKMVTQSNDVEELSKQQKLRFSTLGNILRDQSVAIGDHKKTISEQKIQINNLNIFVKQQSKKIEDLNLELDNQKKVQVTITNNLRKIVEGLSVNYYKHYSLFHTQEFKIVQILTSPEMTELSDFELGCLQSETPTEIAIAIDCVKDDGLRKRFNLKGAKLTFNEKPLEEEEIKIMGRNLEFYLLFNELGTHELLVEYKNIKQLVKFHVGCSTICAEKCVLFLSEEEDDKISKTKFQLGETLKAFAVFKNRDGVILPFFVIEKLQLSAKIGIKGGKKSINRFLVEVEEENYYDGKLFLGEFKLEGKFSCGLFEIIIFDDNGSLIKKEFSIEFV